MKNANPSTRARSHAGGLTLAQQSAVDLLAAGKNDTETAELLKLNRVTVTRWRLYSPEFQAALTVRRADIWGATADRLRSLIPKALDALAAVLDDATNEARVHVALAVLRLAPPAAPSVGSPDPEDYVRGVVDRERARVRLNDDTLDAMFGLPRLEDHENTVRQRLARLSSADAEPDPARSDESDE